MNEAYVLIPLFLWIFNYSIICFFDYLVKKKLGVQSEYYVSLRLPRFIAIILNSCASVGLILYIGNHAIAPGTSTYFVVPYFGIVAYYITSVFRTFKDARNI